MRAPDHPVARALLAATDRPLAAPSANRSGRISPTQAAHVLADLGDNGGDDPRRRRHRAWTGVDHRRCARRRADVAASGRRHGGDHRSRARAACRARARSIMSGRMRRDSSPATMRRRAKRAARCARRPRRRSAAGVRRRRAADHRPRDSISAPRAISPRRRPTCLPRCARSMPAAADTIAVMPIPEEGLGEAINDRLRRAAAPR